MKHTKKPAARKAAGSAKNKKKPQSRFKRFALSFVTAAVVSFQIASCAIHPDWNQRLLDTPLLSTLPIPQWDGMPPTVASGPQAAPAAGVDSQRFAQCRQFFPLGQVPLLQALPLQKDLCFSAFAVLHDGQTKTPVFVVQRLNRRSIEQGKGVSRTDKFYAEARLPQAQRAQLEDYKRSGYSRGHMAPAGDMPSVEAMAQSFSLANMVPQDQTHNGGAWNKIEQDTRKYALRAKGDVFVFTGPVFEPGIPAVTIGPGRVRVPSHLFKLVYDASTGQAWAHWHANSASTRLSAPISYDEFTRRTGMPLLAMLGAPPRK